MHAQGQQSGSNSLAMPSIDHIPSAWKEGVPKLVEGAGEYTVSCEKGLLHAIPMVHINVDVQHTPVVLEQLQDGQHNVVHVAEA